MKSEAETGRAGVGTMQAGHVMAAHELPQALGAIKHDWNGIWLQPALGATAMLIVFSILFRELKPAPADPAA